VKASVAEAGVGVVGVAAAAVAVALSPTSSRAAAAQDWSPFVLVAGLLLVGLTVESDGLFAAAGAALARFARNGVVLFAGASALVAVVTATMNLDTSVAFLTPVLVHTARSRGEDEAPMLYGCLLLSNASSLLLPGSNLTNLIVLGHLHLTGHEFLRRMLLPFVVSVVVTTVVVGIRHRHQLRATVADVSAPPRPVVGLGLVAVVTTLALILAMPQPALPVLAVGLVTTGVRVARGRGSARRAIDTLGVPTLAGLFGVAVALGALGRAWDGPATLLGSLDRWTTAIVGAVTSVAVNNLPAASLLAARTPTHPFALLVGLNIGPNLFFTGSLAWILWLRAARAADADPSVRQAVRLGFVAAPPATLAAVAALTWLS
jgi:arsenical pump membrane protein